MAAAVAAVAVVSRLRSRSAPISPGPPPWCNAVWCGVVWSGPPHVCYVTLRLV